MHASFHDFFSAVTVDIFQYVVFIIQAVNSHTLDNVFYFTVFASVPYRHDTAQWTVIVLNRILHNTAIGRTFVCQVLNLIQ